MLNVEKYVRGCGLESDRAALASTEAVTAVGQSHVPDAAYEQALRQLSEREPVEWTMAGIAAKGWNCPGVSFRTVPETYSRAAPAGSVSVR